MVFESADAYGRFMGRYSEPLAPLFADRALADRADVSTGRALDVGAGPGALTAVLADRLGAEQVSAAEPSPAFAEALRARLSGVDVREAPAEQLPFDDGTFDAALAQLVVHFMREPVRGLAEMGRVTRPGGVVAACVWRFDGRSPLTTYWQAVQDLDLRATGESNLPGVQQGHLEELFSAAGLTDAKADVLTVSVPYATFEEWWEPYTLGVGPAGDYVRGLDAEHREALRRRCQELLPDPPFEVAADAWCVVATAPQK